MSEAASGGGTVAYIQHHLTNLCVGDGCATGGFWSWHVDTLAFSVGLGLLMVQCALADVSMLGLDRFRLRDAVDKRIQQHRASERKAVFQSFLLPDSALTVSDT